MKIVKILYNILVNIRVPFYNFVAKIQVKRMGEACRFHKVCRLTNLTEIGNNCHFNGIEINGKGRCIIGNNFHSGKNVFIYTSDHNYNFGSKIPYDDSFIKEDVIIEDNVWVGTGVIILKGTVLREGCIIQAGSVVTGEIPKGAIAGGHPAIIFAKRDINHYEELKSKGAFY